MSTAKKKLTTCAPKTAVAYARYSSAHQRDVSIEQQLKDIRAYAEREGYTIIHEYADHAKSGFKNSERRAAFHAMLRASASGMFDTVIAWKVDRFGRDRRESATFKGQLADQGVSVVYAMEPIPDGAAGALTEGMLEAIAEWYSRNLSENITRGKHDNASKCLYNGNSVIGYQKGPDGRYEINEPEANVVRRIFSLYSQGMSASAVSKIINEDGIMTNRGKTFCPSRIIYMIQNEAYIGVFHYKEHRIPGGMPAIIDNDTWEVCQALRKKTAKSHGVRTHDYLLTGHITCGLCGSSIRGTCCSTRTISRYYYICSSRKTGKGCHAETFRQSHLENTIFDFLFDNVLNDDMLSRFADLVVETLNASLEESPVVHLEASLRDINRRIDNINRAISEGIWTKSTASMLDELTRQAEELENNIAYKKMTDERTISKDRILFYLKKIADGKRDDSEYLKSLINTFINSITVYDDSIRLVINATNNVERIPPEELPPIEQLPLFERFDFQPIGPSRLVTVEPYPVIVFKIAI